MYHNTEPCPLSVDKDMHAHAHFDLQQPLNNTDLFSFGFAFLVSLLSPDKVAKTQWIAGRNL